MTAIPGSVVVRFTDAPVFDSPRHHGGVEARRVLGPEVPVGPVTVNISTYPRGSGAEATVQASDVVYVVTQGSLVLTVDGTEHLLGELDTAFVPQGALRTLSNQSSEPSRLLVMRPRA